MHLKTTQKLLNVNTKNLLVQDVLDVVQVDLRQLRVVVAGLLDHLVNVCTVGSLLWEHLQGDMTQCQGSGSLLLNFAILQICTHAMPCVNMV